MAAAADAIAAHRQYDRLLADADADAVRSFVLRTTQSGPPTPGGPLLFLGGNARTRLWKNRANSRLAGGALFRTLATEDGSERGFEFGKAELIARREQSLGHHPHACKQQTVRHLAERDAQRESGRCKNRRPVKHGGGDARE